MIIASMVCAGVVATMAHTPVKTGLWNTFVYDKPDKTSVVFGGWSRSVGVKARDYCVYLDVHYADGSKDWGKRADWRQGTHDWEETRAVFLPKKPVAKIEASVLNRKGVGEAEFRDIFLARLKEYGLDRMAYIYGFDERKSDEYAGIDAMWRKLKRDFPGLPVMTTTTMFKDLVKGGTNRTDCITTDWYCPVSNDYDEKTADFLRARGKKVWWYTCCSPESPYANMASLEYPAVEGRLLLGYLTWLYRADGFLFWHVNNWRKGNAPMDESDTYFPEWNTWNYLGIPEDGIFLYPGKEHILPSIRFANIRDGEEDYEYLLRAEKRLGRKAIEEMVRPLVRSQTDFTRDSAALSALRCNLARCME